MSGSKKRIWLPFVNSLNSSQEEKLSRIQLNPISAVTKNDSKYSARLIIAATGLMAVLAVIMIGNGYLRSQPQTTGINASVNLKQAIHGTVGQVNIDRKTFTVSPGFSYDPVISRAAKSLWTVNLPPGENFSGTTTGIGTCFTLPDLNKPNVNAKPVACREIIKLGNVVIVQYAVIKPETASMVARSVFGAAQ